MYSSFLLVRETGIGLAAVRDALGSDTTPWCHSLPRASIPSISNTNKKEEHIVLLFFIGAGDGN